MKDEEMFGDKKLNELTQWGQHKICLYSESQEIYDQFAADKRCLKASPYFSFETKKFLAGDVLFDKKYKDSIERRLKNMGIKK